MSDGLRERLIRLAEPGSKPADSATGSAPEQTTGIPVRRAGFVSPGRRLADMLPTAENGLLTAALIILPLGTAVVRERAFLAFSVLCVLLTVIGELREFRGSSESATPERSSGRRLLNVGIAVMILIPVMQLIPLPAELLRVVSPLAGELRGSHSSWAAISLAPDATRGAIAVCVVYALFARYLSRRLNTRHEISTVLKITAIAAAVTAFTGLIQLTFGMTDYLGLWTHPYRSAAWPLRSGFTNENHCAHFLALSVGPLIWWWCSAGRDNDRSAASNSRRRRHRGAASAHWGHRKQPPEQLCAGILLTIVSAAALLTLSRGGIAAFVLGVIVAVVLLRSVGYLRLNAAWGMLLVAAFIFIVAAVMIFGPRHLQHEWDVTVADSDLSVLLGARYELWKSLFTGFPSVWAAGSGVGSHADVCEVWMQKPTTVRFSHAESGYMQILIEAGGLGLLTLFIMMTAIARTAVRLLRRSHKGASADAGRALATAVVAGLVVSVVHSLIDFPWFIPACMVLTLTQIVCLLRLSDLAAANSPNNTTDAHLPVESQSRQTAGALVSLTLCLLTAVFGLTELAPAAAAEKSWMAYRAAAILMESRQHDPEQARIHLSESIEHLEAVRAATPSDGSAASLLAALYLRRAERSLLASEYRMNIPQLRAAIGESTAESAGRFRQWMADAFPEPTQDLLRARSSAESATFGRPLRGEAFVVLAETEFLNSDPSVSASDNARLNAVRHAIRVRPAVPALLMNCAMQLAESGHRDEADQLFRTVFQISPPDRAAVLSQLSTDRTVAELAELLSPNTEGWLLIDRTLEGRISESELIHVRHSLAESLERETPAAVREIVTRNWKQVHAALTYTGRTNAAVAALRLAARSARLKTRDRVRLAEMLRQHGDGRLADELQNWAELSEGRARI